VILLSPPHVASRGLFSVFFFWNEQEYIGRVWTLDAVDNN